jgi:ketosteroid isomerase-like protein
VTALPCCLCSRAAGARRSPFWAWATGTDLIRGKDDVEKFLADAMQAIGPMLEIRTIVSAPKRVAIEMRERYTVAGDQREAAIAAFYDIDDGQITRVKVYREGSAEA